MSDDAEPLKANSNCAVAPLGSIFVNVARGNYRPANPGALIDSGTTPTVASDIDVLGNPRVTFNGIDIGCFECQDKPTTLVIFR